jgi:hypothetical protein
VLLFVGVVLLIFGVHATNSVADSVKEGLTGRYTDKTMWYIIGGVALALLGAGMTFLSRGRTRIT